jgi:uncharacterized iron-regulated membrane protein
LVVEPQLVETVEDRRAPSEWTRLLRSPMQSRLREVCFFVHRWVGAVLALYMLVISLTGVSLVFHDELSEWACPSPAVKVLSTTTRYAKIIENSEAAYPGYKVTGLIVPDEESQPIDVFALKGDNERINCQVDPYSGTVLGLKSKNAVLETLRDLHFNLFAGKTGRMVNGAGGLLLALLSITGVVVWWRGVAKWLNGFKMSFRGSMKRINWSIHSALGIWVLPFLLLQATSAFYFGFPNFFEQNLNKFAPVSNQKKLEEPEASKLENEGSNSESGSPGLEPDIDKLISIARQNAGSNSAVFRIAFPDKRRHSLRIWLKNSMETNENAPTTQVFMAPKTGQVLAVSTSEAPPTGDQIITWLIKLHFGTFAGTISKCAWLFVGLTPAILSLTGLFLFANGIAARREKKSELSGL